MQRLRRRILLNKSSRGTIVRRVTGFSASLIIGSVIGYFFQEGAQLSIGILIIITATFVVISVGSLYYLSNEIDNRTKLPDLGIEFYSTKDALYQKPEIYKVLQEHIILSKERILSVSLARRSDLASENYRKQYFQQIEKHLKEKAAQNIRFTYHRILQIQRTDKDLTVRKTNLTRSEVDQVIHKHLQEVMKIQNQNHKVSARIQQIDYGTPSVSFIIIDYDTVIFLLPPLFRDKDSSVKYHLDMGIFIHDAAGDLIRHMEDSFNHLVSAADQVDEIEP